MDYPVRMLSPESAESKRLRFSDETRTAEGGGLATAFGSFSNLWSQLNCLEGSKFKLVVWDSHIKSLGT